MRTTVDRLPLVYLENSRDFQLFARLWNMLFLGKKHKAKSILNVLDPMLCPEQYLDLLRDRLGFEPTIKIEPKDMRVILKAFPWLIRNKGSLKAVSTAVRISLMLQGIKSQAFNLFIDRKREDIQIFINRDIDTEILQEIFRHIAPVGFTVTVTRASIEGSLANLCSNSNVFVGETTTQTLSSLKNQQYLDEIDPGTPALGEDLAEATEGYGEEPNAWSVGSIGIQETTKAAESDEEGYAEEINEEGNISQVTDSGELPKTEE